jgi:hypothetical protein
MSFIRSRPTETQERLLKRLIVVGMILSPLPMMLFLGERLIAEPKCGKPIILMGHKKSKDILLTIPPFLLVSPYEHSS